MDEMGCMWMWIKELTDGRRTNGRTTDVITGWMDGWAVEGCVDGWMDAQALGDVHSCLDRCHQLKWDVVIDSEQSMSAEHPYSIYCQQDAS